MANIHGKNTVAYIAGFDLTTFLNKASMDFMKELIETPTFGSTYMSRIAGENDGKLELGGLWDGTATTGIDARADAQMTGAQLVTTIGLNGSVTGLTNRAGLFLLRQGNYKTEPKRGQAIAFSLSGEADGYAYLGYWLHNMQAETSASNTVGFDWGSPVGVAPGVGFVAHIQCLAFLGTSITATIEHSTNGSVWTALTGGAFSAISAANSSQQLTQAAVPVNQFTRLAWTGTFSSATFAVALARIY